MTISKRGRKPKYIHTIVLTDINARTIYNRYKSNNSDDSINNVKFNLLIEYNASDPNSSDITDISSKNIAPAILTDNKIITMIDYVNFGCLADCTDLRCFHDHHKFDTCPIGLPIKYVPKKRDKNIDDEKITGVNDYFLTYGVFCSFPCCLGFLEEHKNVPLFRNSKQLLYSMYYKLYKSELLIQPAPSWEIMSEYGGVPTLDIKNFRESYSACNYHITENIKRPYMVSVGKYIEQRPSGII